MSLPQVRSDVGERDVSFAELCLCLKVVSKKKLIILIDYLSENMFELEFVREIASRLFSAPFLKTLLGPNVIG